MGELCHGTLRHFIVVTALFSSSPGRQKFPWILYREQTHVEHLWLERNCLCHPPKVCSWNKRLQQFRQLQWKCLRRTQASLPLTPLHCVQRFGSPVRRMFFKRISQRVFRVFGLDFAAGFSATKPFLPSSLLLSLFLFLCLLCLRDSLSKDR